MTRFLALIACVLPVFAQSWEPVRALGPGARVKVREVGGIEHKGNITAVTSDAITIATGAASLSIERTKVGRVQVHGKNRRARNIAIGAAVGVGVAVAMDQTFGRYLRNEGADNHRAITYAAPIGVFTAIGAALSPYKTIYRAP
jgi:hypothetical protein